MKKGLLQTVSGGGTVIPEDDLSNYYDLRNHDGSSTVTSDVGGDLSVSGATWDSTNKYYDFDGSNDFVSIAASSKIVYGTHAFVFKVDSLSHFTILYGSKYSRWAMPDYIGINTNGSLYARLSGYPDNTSRFECTSASGVISTGTTYVVTADLGGDGINIYVNGTSVASDSSASGFGLDGGSDGTGGILFAQAYQETSGNMNMDGEWYFYARYSDIKTSSEHSTMASNLITSFGL